MFMIYMPNNLAKYSIKGNVLSDVYNSQRSRWNRYFGRWKKITASIQSVLWLLKPIESSNWNITSDLCRDLVHAPVMWQAYNDPQTRELHLTVQSILGWLASSTSTVIWEIIRNKIMHSIFPAEHIHDSPGANAKDNLSSMYHATLKRL